MATLIFNNLKRQTNVTDSVNSGYTYTDVFMDLAQDESSIIRKDSILQTDKKLKKDLRVLHDEAAIANSIWYIMSTMPGQRPLVPSFGCNLHRYIGEPISADISELISSDIAGSINTWEPRVKVVSVIVEEKSDLGEYDVTVVVKTPKLTQSNIRIFGKLYQTGEFIRVTK